MTNMFKHPDRCEYTGWPKTPLDTFEDYLNHVEDLSNEQIAWEFIRRNPLYIDIWKRSRKEAESIMRKYEKPLKNDKIHRHECPILNGSLVLSLFYDHKDEYVFFFMTGRSAMEFGMEILIDPDRDDVLELVPRIENIPIIGKSIPELVSRNRFKMDDEGMIQYVPVNLLAPIEPQLKIAQKELKRRQKFRSIKPRDIRKSRNTKDRKMIALYLFLLDGRDNVKRRLHRLWQKFGMKHGDHYRWKNYYLKAALKIRDGDYRKFIQI